MILLITIVATPLQPKIRTMTAGTKTVLTMLKEPGGIRVVQTRT